MEIRQVTAIVQTNLIEKIERRLQEIHVKGLSINPVKGYGEYANFFARDWMTAHTRIEIFAEKSRAEEIAQAIMDVAHTGGNNDGIVAVLPVEKLFRIRAKTEAGPGEI